MMLRCSGAEGMVRNSTVTDSMLDSTWTIR